MPLLCGALVRTHFDLAPVALLLARAAAADRRAARVPGMAVLGHGAR